MRNRDKKFEVEKGWCYQILFYIGMIKLINFTLSVPIFIQGYNGSLMDNIENIVILSANIVLYLITIVLFYFEPDPFDYFRY